MSLQPRLQSAILLLSHRSLHLLSSCGRWKNAMEISANQNKGQSQRCQVRIDGIKELKLIVDCPGGNVWAFAIWASPLLKE